MQISATMASIRSLRCAGVPAAMTSRIFLAFRYKRIARRRSKKRALVAVGNSLLTIIWRLFSDPAARFTGLGPDWHDRLVPLRRKRQLIAKLERLSGQKVTLNDAPDTRSAPTPQPRSADAPPGAAACPLTHRFSIQHPAGHRGMSASGPGNVDAGLLPATGEEFR